jgi:hypothetical protein
VICHGSNEAADERVAVSAVALHTRRAQAHFLVEEKNAHYLLLSRLTSRVGMGR